MKKKLLLLAGFFLFLPGGGTVAFAQETTDSLFQKSERVLTYLIQGKGTDLNVFLRDDLKSQLSPEMLNGLFNQVEAQFGKLLKQGEWKKTTVAGTLLYYKDLQFEKASLRLLLSYESNGALNTLRIVPGEKVADKVSDTTIKYKEQNITVETGNVRLPGKLMLPDGKGNFPVVVLVHGSGPQDKDESIGPNKVFKDLAEGLAKRDIVTFRYDKRTYVYQNNVKNFDDETVDDAVSALKLVAKQPQIDTGRIYVLGHSLGGRLLPRIVEKAGSEIVKGCIGLAASARPMQKVLLEQVAYLNTTGGEEAGRNAEAVLRLFEQLPASYLEDDKTFDAPTAAKASKVAYCFLQGGKDYNVTKTDFDLWKKALPKACFYWFPDLNHIFRTTEGKSIASDYLKEGPFSEEALSDIAEFVNTKI